MGARQLERARDAFARQAWADADEYFAAADRAGALEAADLERFATAAFMVGRLDDYVALLDRAYAAHLTAGERLRAVRCAFWIGVNLAQRGQLGAGGGWLARAQRLVDHESRCAEGGYVLLPVVFQHEAAGDLEGAARVAAEAASIGAELGDRDLFALAAHEQGHLLIRLGRISEGVALLDEAMLAVTGRELAPIPTGIVYCGAILAADDAFEVGRAQEWTAALSEWCAQQPDLVAFTGRCLVHRAQIMQRRGAWDDALAEAHRAAERCLRGENPAAAGEARYVEAEIHRLRGAVDDAETAYRAAVEHGREPQPGLAQLRVAQGNAAAAEAAIRRVEATPSEPRLRATILTAYVEIMLALDDLDSARAAYAELASLVQLRPHSVLGASALQARGCVALAEGDAGGALTPLREALTLWQALGIVYEAARTRELLGHACRVLGDTDTATLELEAARETYARLGAAPDLARAQLLLEVPRVTDRHGLTERELEVLQHLAAGETNRTIAAALVLSTRTVDRHVSNIYTKLGVSSRAGATAYAHKHALV